MAFKLTRKRVLAQGLIGACVAAGATVGAVPIPIADSLVLSPLELGELHGLARLYGIDKDEGSKQFLDSIVQVGTASVVAHSAISAGEIDSGRQHRGQCAQCDCGGEHHRRTR